LRSSKSLRSLYQISRIVNTRQQSFSQLRPLGQAVKSDVFAPLDTFLRRHNGPTKEIPEMLKTIGVSSLDELSSKMVPDNIALRRDLNLVNIYYYYLLFYWKKNFFSRNIQKLKLHYCKD